MRLPEIEKVHCLCRDSVTSQGKNESVDATEAPSPNSTSREGKAQHSSVLRDVKSEK